MFKKLFSFKQTYFWSSLQGNFMRPNITILILLILSLHSIGQSIGVDNVKSSQDKTLLRNFWKEFRSVIISKDKNQLATLCEFPFYCRPCIDNPPFKGRNLVTIKVTKKLFYESQYKVFFKKPIEKLIEEHKAFDPNIFFPTYDIHKKLDG